MPPPSIPYMDLRYRGKEGFLTLHLGMAGENPHFFDPRYRGTLDLNTLVQCTPFTHAV